MFRFWDSTRMHYEEMRQCASLYARYKEKLTLYMIYRRMSSCSNLVVPPNVMLMLKSGLDSWTFDAFELNEASENHALKFVGFELFHKYNLIKKFQIDTTCLENLLIQLETGYSRHNNPYHNLVHAADVTQTCHVMMSCSKIDVSAHAFI
ncbi:unnamed protein product [Protopolystoma xenopodis]|uniref:PDEase domain-containing protein n=1 Tax=Protopolystoma xenopodis TaxID=117903 RepID=A0A448WB51_9PLAT|nr:unnamed protein product [Protopolystoma xenopodis]